MHKKSFEILLSFALLMLSACLPNAFAAASSDFVANYNANIPTIDGRLNSTEWSDALRCTFNLTGPSNITTWAYLKHNGTHIYIGLVMWRIGNGAYDQFIIYFDEGDDGSYGSGTGDGVLTSNQEDLKSCASTATVTLQDGCYINSTFHAYASEIDFEANCTYETDHSTAEWEIEYWEGLLWVDDHWEWEFAIPFVGNDGGTDDVSDLNCTITDTIGIKFQYFTQPVANYFYPAENQYAIGTYASLSFLPPPTIESCNMTGTRKDNFDFGETVYVNGSGYGPSTTYDLYVVEDTNWTDGMSIPSRVPDTAINVSSDASGEILPTAVWNDTNTFGDFDVIVDINGNGVYDAEIDVLDDNDVHVTAGFFVPEFASILILPLFMTLSLLATLAYKKRRF